MIDFYYDRKQTYEVSRKFNRKHILISEVSPKGGKTFVVEKIERPELLGLAIGTKVLLKIGLAKCHKDDAFVKALGRSLATQTMSVQEFEVVKLILDKKSQIVTLKNKDFIVELSFITGKNLSRLDFVESV